MQGRSTEPVVGLDVAAEIGMPIEEVATPALIIDLDQFEQNVATLKDFIEAKGVRLRAHAKTHKSADIARYQRTKGGACGVCCQKVSEAQVLVAAGIGDVLVSNQVVDKRQIRHLAEMAKSARVMVCVDDAGNIDDLAAAATAAGVEIGCLVEIDVGAGRCGVRPGAEATVLAGRIAQARGLRFAGLQAYQGSAQHKLEYETRKGLIDQAIAKVRETVDMLEAEGLGCETVAGAGTGTFQMEAASGLYNELQCGSYVFMDADYQRILDESGEPISMFGNSLFILSTVMSKTRPGFAVCDAGLKAQSADSGLPRVHQPDGVTYTKWSDEHGVIEDPEDKLKLGDKVWLVPAHCDPTCNLYDTYVGVRGGKVECLWPVTARGRLF
jgi:3-hydroxy-D-aspartate aldolase